MKKKITLLLLILVLCTTVGTLSACHVGDKPLFDDFLSQQGLTAQVTYYSNGGEFKNSSRISKDFYYRPDTYVANYGVTENEGDVSRVNYVFTGWNYAQLDADGNPVTETDSTGNVHYKDSGVKAEFPMKIADKQHIYLCATWEQDVYLSYKLVSPVAVETTVEDEEGNSSVVTYQPGAEIKQEFFGEKSEILLSKQSPLQTNNATFLQLYLDEECTIPAGETLTKPTDGQNLSIYAKYIEGVWTLVKTAQNAYDMFKSLHLARNFYIYNDIDMSQVQNAFVTATSADCKATIQGNGHTLSNLTVQPRNSKGNTAQTDLSYSLFGSLKAQAKITDLTIENVTVNYTINKAAITNVYAFFTAFENGATIQNVTVNNLTMTVKKPKTDEDASGKIYTEINNIQINETDNSYEQDNWLFGVTGKGPESKTEVDQSFIDAYPGFTFTNCSLIVQVI